MYDAIHTLVRQEEISKEQENTLYDLIGRQDKRLASAYQVSPTSPARSLASSQNFNLNPPSRSFTRRPAIRRSCSMPSRTGSAAGTSRPRARARAGASCETAGAAGAGARASEATATRRPDPLSRPLLSQPRRPPWLGGRASIHRATAQCTRHPVHTPCAYRTTPSPSRCTLRACSVYAPCLLRARTAVGPEVTGQSDRAAGRDSGTAPVPWARGGLKGPAGPGDSERGRRSERGRQLLALSTARANRP